jgi:hypothetical protein
MFALEANKGSHTIHGVISSFYFYRFGIHNAIRHLFSGTGDDIAECLPGDFHFLRGTLMIQTFQISQPQGLELVHGQTDFIQSTHWYPGRFKIIGFRCATDSS